MKFASFALPAFAAIACATGAHATKTLFEDNGVSAYVYDNYEEWLGDLAGRETRLEDFSDADLDPAIYKTRNATIVDGAIDTDLRDQERWLELRLHGTSALAFTLTEREPKGFPGVAISASFGPLASLYTFVTASTGFFGMIADRTITELDIVDRPSSGPSHIRMDDLYLVDAPAVPEPATWALSILGFGLVGAAARQRRSRIAFG